MYKDLCHKFNRWFDSLPATRRFFTFLGITLIPVWTMSIGSHYNSPWGTAGLVVVLLLILVRMEK